jgi:predicted nucleic acid-binding protein
VAPGLTLDSGALIAAEKNALSFWAIWKRAIERHTRVTLPAVVLAQVWRGNSPVIARLLPGCEIEPMDEVSAKHAGELLAKSRTADVIDAAVVLGAVARGDGILTSDPADVRRLVAAAGSKIRVVPV